MYKVLGSIMFLYYNYFISIKKIEHFVLLLNMFIFSHTFPLILVHYERLAMFLLKLS